MELLILVLLECVPCTIITATTSSSAGSLKPGKDHISNRLVFHLQAVHLNVLEWHFPTNVANGIQNSWTEFVLSFQLTAY